MAIFERTVCCLQMPALDVKLPPTPFEAALRGHTPFAAAPALIPTPESSQDSQETPGTTPGHSYVRAPTLCLRATVILVHVHAPAHSPAGALPLSCLCTFRAAGAEHACLHCSTARKQQPSALLRPPACVCPPRSAAQDMFMAGAARNRGAMGVSRSHPNLAGGALGASRSHADLARAGAHSMGSRPPDPARASAHSMRSTRTHSSDLDCAVSIPKILKSRCEQPPASPFSGAHASAVDMQCSASLRPAYDAPV